MAPDREPVAKTSGDFAADKSNEAGETVHEEVLPSAEALAEAMAHGTPSPWSKSLLKLYCFCAVAFLCSTMNGM